MKPILAIMAASVALSACAQKAADIAPSYASRALYDSYSCEQIRFETEEVVNRLNTLSGHQDKKATTDAVLTGVGIVLFWPALIFTSGLAGPDDQSTEIAQLKGQAEALSATYRAKGCGTSGA
jgi:hypothetical protein